MGRQHCQRDSAAKGPGPTAAGYPHQPVDKDRHKRTQHNVHDVVDIKSPGQVGPQQVKKRVVADAVADLGQQLLCVGYTGTKGNIQKIQPVVVGVQQRGFEEQQPDGKCDSENQHGVTRVDAICPRR